MMLSPQNPTTKAFLICDQAIREEGTCKWSLIGTFDRIRARAFPTRHPQLCVYLQFADAQGHYQVRLDLVDQSNQKTIGSMSGEMEVPHILQPVDFVVCLRNLEFAHPGTYEFRFFANERIVATKDFSVLQLEPKEGNP